MANQRASRLSPTGLDQASAPARRRGPIVAGVVVAALLALAFVEGGEEPLHPIAEDVALPEQGQ